MLMLPEENYQKWPILGFSGVKIDPESAQTCETCTNEQLFAYCLNLY